MAGTDKESTSSRSKKESLNKVAAKVNNIKKQRGEESDVASGNALNQIIHRDVCEKKKKLEYFVRHRDV